jgi:cell wall-associated NlpC family hydrolase
MSVRKIVCFAAAFALAWSPLAGVRPACARSASPSLAAAAHAGRQILTASTSHSKPPALPHADRAPSVPGSSEPRMPITGPVPPAPAVPRADGSGSGTTHLDAGAPSPSSSLMAGSGGTNMITFGQFDDGDIVVVQDPLSFTGHAGLFDSRFYVDIRSYAMLSANTTPLNGVQREQCLKYRAADRAWGLWVPREANHGPAVRDWAYRQMGKPYNLLAAKTDLRSFYCSKLVWAAWRYTAGVDLDADGGYWVWPADLVNSPNTRVFGYWS